MIKLLLLYVIKFLRAVYIEKDFNGWRSVFYCYYLLKSKSCFHLKEPRCVTFTSIKNCK